MDWAPMPPARRATFTRRRRRAATTHARLVEEEDLVTAGHRADEEDLALAVVVDRGERLDHLAGEQLAELGDLTTSPDVLHKMHDAEWPRDQDPTPRRSEPSRPAGPIRPTLRRLPS